MLACSPYRVPIARLAAAQAAIEEGKAAKAAAPKAAKKPATKVTKKPVTKAKKVVAKKKK